MPDLETKFVFDNRRRHVVQRWLGLRCPADRRHPVYRVSSIYYDTRSWRSLGEKVNSDFHKTKIRLRWYSDVATGRATGTAHLEIKFKRGRLRHKVRSPLELGDAASGSLQQLREPDVATVLRSHGFEFPPTLCPVFQIDYTRLRFVHASGADLCLDHDIRVPRVNCAMVRRHDSRPLNEAVCELKGDSGELPPDLRFLTRLGCRKRSFSKYLACYRRITGMID